MSRRSEQLFLRKQSGYSDTVASTVDFSGTVTASGTLNASGTLQVGGTAVTATAAELNMAADNSANVEVVTTTNAIAAAESGTTYFLNSATGFASTLPAPAAGLRFTFIVGATAPTSGNHTVVTTSSSNVVKGAQHSVAGDAGDSGTADDTISFVANSAVSGDMVTVISDGTNWYARAYSTLAASITFTQAS